MIYLYSPRVLSVNLPHSFHLHGEIDYALHMFHALHALYTWCDGVQVELSVLRGHAHFMSTSPQGTFGLWFGVAHPAPHIPPGGRKMSTAANVAGGAVAACYGASV